MVTVKRPSPSHRQVLRRASAARTLFPFLGWLSALAVSVTTLAPATAHAEGPAPAPAPTTDFCRKVTARAEADSAQLFAPTAAVHLIRYPQSSLLDTLGVNVGRDVQPRATLSVGFIDIYKGFGVREVAKNDCLRQETTVALQEALLRRDDGARRDAYEKKVEFLKGRQSDLEGMISDAERRFTAGVATLAELHEIRRKVLDTTSRGLEAERALAVLRSRPAPTSTETLDELVVKYEQRSAAFEGSVEHVRNLSPWKLNLTGGATAVPRVDYFGVLELSYNFGGLFSVGAESRAVAARSDEMKNARYEMRQQVEFLRREVKAEAEVTKKQVAVIDDELARIGKDRATIEGSEAPNKAHALAILKLQVIDLEAERVFLSALSERQTNVGGRQ